MARWCWTTVTATRYAQRNCFVWSLVDDKSKRDFTPMSSTMAAFLTTWNWRTSSSTIEYKDSKKFAGLVSNARSRLDPPATPLTQNPCPVFAFLQLWKTHRPTLRIHKKGTDTLWLLPTLPSDNIGSQDALFDRNGDTSLGLQIYDTRRLQSSSPTPTTQKMKANTWHMTFALLSKGNAPQFAKATWGAVLHYWT